MNGILTKLERRGFRDDEIDARHLPDDGWRVDFERRKMSLNAALEPAFESDIHALLASASYAFAGAQNLSEADARRKITIYAAQLRSFPLWAIRGGLERLMREAKFFPALSEVLAATQFCAQGVKRELAQIERILKAKVYSLPSAQARLKFSHNNDAFYKNTVNLSKHGDVA